MRFKVVPPKGPLPRVSSPTFVLFQDNWNDYSFQTQYHLHYVTVDIDTLIGPVKILRKGQTTADGIQIVSDFDTLSEDFVSVGQSLDYYQRLAELGSGQRELALTSLRDYVRFPDLGASFKTEPGWSTSLFRNFNENDEFLLLAKALLDSDYTSMPAEELQFTFRVKGWQKAFDFHFGGPDKKRHWFLQQTIVPERVIAIIGRNGSGKSTLLARLARVAHGSGKNREEGRFAELGEITPRGIGFPRIITVSYSAFDSFRLPGVSPRRLEEPDEREQIVKDVRRGEGRFIFCGLRDIASELESDISNSKLNETRYVGNDRVSITLLKSIDTLADEFVRTIDMVKKNGRVNLLERVFKILTSDPSFSENDLELLAKSNSTDDLKLIFLSWSTGHKIVTQILISLVAYVAPRSLVLLDEPETHLHPPLLAALMHAVRLILNEQKAFAVVATHSPVVLQETLARHVFIVRREGNVTEVYRPEIETFAENIGALTSEVFGLNSGVTDYHKILDNLTFFIKDLDQIEALFAPHGLSMQARAYVMSRLARGGDNA